MVYQGSKNRLAKELVPIIQKYIHDNNIKIYVEPFVGGANMIDKIHCEKRIGTDLNENVITLLKYVQEHPDIPIAPEDVSFEHYADVRSNQHTGKYSPEYVSLIGYCASYGGRYFEGGYGKDPTGKRCIYKERLKNLKEQAPLLKNIRFGSFGYLNYEPSKFKDCLFYLDPPYRDTKQYAKNIIDYDEFYHWCKELAENNIVLISEFSMPDDFKCIWEKERKILQRSDRAKGKIKTERLYIA